MIDPERALWLAVIATAIDDACGKTKLAGTYGAVEIFKARNWLTKPNSDFVRVCNLAGLDADAVRERAAKLLPPTAPYAPPPKRLSIERGGRYLFNGMMLTIGQLSKATGISRGVIYYRLREGWTIERATTEPISHVRSPGKSPKLHTHDGQSRSLQEWSAICGHSTPMLMDRLRRGMSIGEAITTPRLRAPSSNPGAVKNFPSNVKTGPHSTTQDLTEIEFLQ